MFFFFTQKKHGGLFYTTGTEVIQHKNIIEVCIENISNIRIQHNYSKEKNDMVRLIMKDETCYSSVFLTTKLFSNQQIHTQLELNFIIQSSMLQVNSS